MTASNKTSSPPVIRLAHPLAFAAFLRNIDAPVERHLRRAGLPTLCDNHKANICSTGKDKKVLSKKLDYVDTLRLLRKSYIANNYVSEPFAASLMDTSVRILTRRLSEHSLTYRSLLDEVRFNTAKELLQTPGVKIVDVARSVGFEDHSHFTRMFRRIGGLTPCEFRKAPHSN